jgi:hypothetical protein
MSKVSAEIISDMRATHAAFDALAREDLGGIEVPMRTFAPPEVAVLELAPPIGVLAPVIE